MPIGRKQFTFELVTPLRASGQMQCTFAAVPARDGEIGLLAGHAPLLCALGPGEFRVEAPGGDWINFYVEGGLAEMRQNVLTLLAERATPVDDLDGPALEQSLAALEEAPEDESSADRAKRLAARERVRIQLAVIARDRRRQRKER